MGSFSAWHWLIVLLVVVMVFGTKKIKNIGTDLGGAIKGFKDGMKDADAIGIELPKSSENMNLTSLVSDHNNIVERL